MPVLYFNPVTGQVFVCTTDTEDQFRRQIGDHWNLTKFRRIEVVDFVNIEPTTYEGCNTLTTIENHARPALAAVAVSAVRDAFIRFFGGAR